MAHDRNEQPHWKTHRASRTQWLITLYAGGGEFCDGYILSIIGVALPLLTVAFSLTRRRRGPPRRRLLVGMFFGGLIFGAVTDKFGRQKVYIADLACFVVLSALQFFASEPWQLIVLRTLMGVAVGADLAIAGTIASEFAPQKSRGPLLGRLGHDVLGGSRGRVHGRLLHAEPRA